MKISSWCIEQSRLRTYKALGMVLLGSCLLSLNSLIVKSVTYMSAGELLFVRFTGMLLLNLPCLLVKGGKVTLTKTDVVSLLARGVFGCTGLYLSYAAMKLMPIAESSVIVSTSSVWVMVLSRIFLKENFDLLNSLSVALTVLGLVLMSGVLDYAFRDSAERFRDMEYWTGCLLSLLSAVVNSFTYVFLRKLKDIPETVTIAFHSIIGVVCTAAVIVAKMDFKLPDCGFDGAKMVLLGVLSFLGQLAITGALRIEKAGAVSSVRLSFRAIVLFVLQAAVFGDVPDVWSSIAAVLVFCSLWLSVLRKTRQQRRHLNREDNAAGERETPC